MKYILNNTLEPGTSTMAYPTGDPKQSASQVLTKLRSDLEWFIKYPSPGVDLTALKTIANDLASKSRVMLESSILKSN